MLDNDQYKIFAGYSETFKIDTKEFENAQFQIKSSDEERLKVTDYGDGTFKIDTFVSGVASVSITVQSAVDTASFNMNFVIGVDAVALRAVTTVDFMTAEAAEIPYDVLNKVMSRIINEVKGVNRVFYDLTSKPPGTIEFE